MFREFERTRERSSIGCRLQHLQYMVDDLNHRVTRLEATRLPPPRFGDFKGNENQRREYKIHLSSPGFQSHHQPIYMNQTIIPAPYQAHFNQQQAPTYSNVRQESAERSRESPRAIPTQFGENHDRSSDYRAPHYDHDHSSSSIRPLHGSLELSGPSAPEQRNTSLEGSISQFHSPPALIDSTPTPSHQPESVQATAGNQTLRKKVTCPDCGSQHVHAHALRRHMRKRHAAERPARGRGGNGDFQCDQCLYKFKTKYSLQKHRYKIHNPNSTYQKRGQRVPGGVPCPYGCDKVVSSLRMLESHKFKFHRAVGGR
ncbi:hypothetical protein F4779DRAFT_593301 [Xylariaceae sp. FL0662B]|nr:hypothetical protein F4779DRAFT_593301 [Xylariaceae sp. FL0662B]